jgi:hypothetical protein
MNEIAMTEKQILETLLSDYPDKVHPRYPFPEPYKGSGEIKAIILGADPTRIVKDQPLPFNMVFELDNDKSPYFRSIRKNIDLLDGLSMENIYAQNLCRNYFNKETSANKAWVDIARNYWSGFLAKELDSMFTPSVPVLITTEFILKACIIKGKVIKANNIYSQCLCIAAEDNLFGREMIAFYRHYNYSIDRWPEYRKFVSGKINSAS